MNFTMKSARAYVAIVVLVIGIYLLIEGAYMVQDMLINVSFIVLGAVLTLGYFWLIGDTIERWLRAPRGITFMPLLLVLGIVILSFGLTRSGLVTTELKLSLVIPGLVLALVAVFVLLKAKKQGL
ncbi:MAG: hypothetical protein E3J91_02665 [Hadesarchaea archaeon]|nr:MAG: hypothetical protein E3J91_02665 [Hadesarchaea archaeon]